MKTVEFRISQVENGFIVVIFGGADPFNMSNQYQYVFNTWEAVSVFVSSLNDKFK